MDNIQKAADFAEKGYHQPTVKVCWGTGYIVMETEQFLKLPPWTQKKILKLGGLK
ncbi:hypothetical protein [Intestinibacillus massiliensis]|uniref:hypothetical protein n=1 Tax=Intestinibacillus massiliensis TaxID=1871029 RepID=UPI0013562EF7|nr:hypothetical protein [Intestinibacillus massiliensis]